MPPASDFNDDQAASDDVEDYSSDIEESQSIIAATNQAIDKIDAALPLVHDLDTCDTEMDNLAELAQSTFKDFCAA